MSAEETTKAMVKALQEAIEEYFHKETIEKGTQFIHSAKDTVRRWVAEGIFKFSDLSHEQRMNVSSHLCHISPLAFECQSYTLHANH